MKRKKQHGGILLMPPCSLHRVGRLCFLLSTKRKGSSKVKAALSLARGNISAVPRLFSFAVVR